MRWIELAGIPGSGKTTLYKQLAERLRPEGALFTVDDLYARLAPAPESLRQTVKNKLKPLSQDEVDRKAKTRYLQHNLESKLLLDYQMAHINQLHFLIHAVYQQPAEDREKIMRWILRVFTYHQTAQSTFTESESFLIDEGFVQRLITLYVTPANTPAPEQIENYSEQLPKISTLFILETDLETAFQRITRRGLPLRLKDQPEESVREFLQNAQTSLTGLTALLEKSGVPVIKLPSDDTTLDKTLHYLQDQKQPAL